MERRKSNERSNKTGEIYKTHQSQKEQAELHTVVTLQSCPPRHNGLLEGQENSYKDKKGNNVDAA